jgi:hypothetical protein
MEGLVLPISIFALACLAFAVKLGGIAAWQRWWAALRIRKLLQLELPRSHYTVLHNVLLPGLKEPLRIDYLVVSAYGLFVIKQVNGSGLIAGKPGDARWSRSSRRKEHLFSNPLFECLNEVKAVRTLLGLDASLLNFVLVFTGNVKFGNPMPVNVTRLDGLPLFIEGRDKLLIDFDDLPLLVGRIGAARPGASFLRNSVQPASR